MVVDEYSTQCEICGIYNVKCICPDCFIKMLEDLIENHSVELNERDVVLVNDIKEKILELEVR